MVKNLPVISGQVAAKRTKRWWKLWQEPLVAFAVAIDLVEFSPSRT
jgi:hypothetical protein